MRRRLMPHQSRALRYLLRNRHGALFMAMRTGKTLTVIRRALLARPRRVLVMAPNSALGSWERELRLEGEGDVVYLHGDREARLALLREGHRWNLINKEGWAVVPEIANRVKTGRHATGPAPAGDRVSWDAVVVDESTFIKGPKARVTRFALEHLRRCAAHRYILAGLPNPEGPEDYWCQLAFLYGQAFGCRNFWQFRALAFEPRADMFGRVEMRIRSEWERAIRDEIRERAFVCSRQDARMPERHVREVRRLEMPADLRRSYDKAERDFELKYGDVHEETTSAGARWQWMRQMCGGFIKGRCVWPGKAEELLALLRGELRNEQVVVWFAYNQEVAHAWDCRDEVPGAVQAMTGATDLDARRAMVRDFHEGRTRVLLLQQKIAEFGMDLSAADTAIYYSRHPALQTNAQCQDRIAHPSKQNNLLHVDLVVRDSVDEDVADLLIEKRWASQRTFDAAVATRVEERGRA